MTEAYVLARFTNAATLHQAIGAMKALGYQRMDAWLPYPIESIENALGLAPSPLPRWSFICGMAGGAFAYAVQAWTNAIDFPMYVGGFAPHDPFAFLPIVFESTILFAVLGCVAGFFYHTALPAWWHPAFAAARSEDASRDGFILLISARDPLFVAAQTEGHLRASRAQDVQTVHA
jgi:hypothetical protein